MLTLATGLCQLEQSTASNAVSLSEHFSVMLVTVPSERQTITMLLTLLQAPSSSYCGLKISSPHVLPLVAIDITMP